MELALPAKVAVFYQVHKRDFFFETTEGLFQLLVVFEKKKLIIIIRH